MDVVSASPLRVSGVVWQPRPGTWALTAVCRATYRLEPGVSPLADVQEPPLEEDNYWDDDLDKSLYAASDLAPFKRRADVVLVGHAFAPEGQPVRSLVARLQVGQIDKLVEVWCDRVIAQDGRLVEGRRFTKMPLRWERAAGGPGTWNPVGMRFDAPPDMYGAVPVPNLQPPGRLVAWRGDTFEPIGFGPIAPTWPTRAIRGVGVRYAGAGEPWSLARWFAGPIPEGLDPGCFNVALPDQQVDELRIDERLILENLHARHARLVTNLIGVKPRSVVERATGEREELCLVADTLWVDTDRGLATLTWRGSVGLRAPAERGRLVVWAEGERVAEPLPAAALVPNPAPSDIDGSTAGDEDEEAIRTMVPRAVRTGFVRQQHEEADVQTAIPPLNLPASGPVLPFRQGTSTLGTAGSFDEPVVRQAATVFLREADTAGLTTAAPLMAPERDVLPFHRPDSHSEPRDGDSIEARSAVEFATDPRAEAGSMSLAQTDTHYAASSAWAVSLQTSVPHESSQPADGAPHAGAPLRELPLPPPMIGPLAHVETQPQPTDAAEATHQAAPSPASPPVVVQVSVAPRPEEFPLERCAGITASIARRPAESGHILAEHELTPASWSAIEQHWSEAIRCELAKGRNALLRRFDEAYVAQLERERGAIKPIEYARLVVAAERGTVHEALVEMGLPSSAMIRVERVWIGRLVSDVVLSERVGAAIDAVRAC